MRRLVGGGRELRLHELRMPAQAPLFVGAAQVVLELGELGVGVVVQDGGEGI